MDRCVCCGFPVPEGRQVCPVCEGKAEPDFITKDGRPGYFKSTSPKFGAKIPEGMCPQLQLYELLRRRDS